MCSVTNIVWCFGMLLWVKSAKSLCVANFVKSKAKISRQKWPWQLRHLFANSATHGWWGKVNHYLSSLAVSAFSCKIPRSYCIYALCSVDKCLESWIYIIDNSVCLVWALHRAKCWESHKFTLLKIPCVYNSEYKWALHRAKCSESYRFTFLRNLCV